MVESVEREDQEHAHVIIRRHLMREFAPVYRWRCSFYSERLERLVSYKEVMACCSSGLISSLFFAVEWTEELSERFGSAGLVKLFKAWAPVAWADLLHSLKEPPPEGVSARGERFVTEADFWRHCALAWDEATDEEKALWMPRGPSASAERQARPESPAKRQRNGKPRP